MKHRYTGASAWAKQTIGLLLVRRSQIAMPSIERNRAGFSASRTGLLATGANDLHSHFF